MVFFLHGLHVLDRCVMLSCGGNARNMKRSRLHACLVAAYFLALAAFTEPSLGLPTASSISRVKSKDGVFIAIECAGAGPTFLVVHGGTGDRSRWTPLFPLLVSNFRVCAMDRRGHGASGDSS